MRRAHGLTHGPRTAGGAGGLQLRRGRACLLLQRHYIDTWSNISFYPGIPPHPSHALRVNHYVLQSWEYWCKVRDPTR